MKSKVVTWISSVALVSVWMTFGVPEFLADRASAEQVNINGQYSCAQIKEECAKAGGKYSHIDQPGGEACTCYTPCGARPRGVT